MAGRRRTTAASLDGLRAEMTALLTREAELIARRKTEIGELVARANALDLGDEVIIGALCIACDDASEAARFRERANHDKRATQRPSRSAPAATAEEKPTFATDPAEREEIDDADLI